jgi:hypothetical protein
MRQSVRRSHRAVAFDCLYWASLSSPRLARQADSTVLQRSGAVPWLAIKISLANPDFADMMGW